MKINQTIILLCILLVIAMGFSNTQTTKKETHHQVSFYSTDLKLLSKLIKTYNDVGFVVISTTPQQINVDSRGLFGNHPCPIFVVMDKVTIQ